MSKPTATVNRFTNIDTGEIHEGINAATADKMRDCDKEITALDTEIERLKDELKGVRESRSAVVEQLRGYVRGEQALPFDGEE